MQRGLGEAARSWGSPPLAIAVVSPTRYCIKNSNTTKAMQRCDPWRI
ncbi:hypothetical protein [Moorena bouillonii]|nr:hypothetical protein [Moorena bouillonii]